MQYIVAITPTFPEINISLIFYVLRTSPSTTTTVWPPCYLPRFGRTWWFWCPMWKGSSPDLPDWTGLASCTRTALHWTRRVWGTAPCRGWGVAVCKVRLVTTIPYRWRKNLGILTYQSVQIYGSILSSPIYRFPQLPGPLIKGFLSSFATVRRKAPSAAWSMGGGSEPSSRHSPWEPGRQNILRIWVGLFTNIKSDELSLINYFVVLLPS